MVRHSKRGVIRPETPEDMKTILAAVEETQSDYADKYPHMTTIKYVNPRPPTPVTPPSKFRVHSPMNGTFRYNPVILIPIKLKITSTVDNKSFYHILPTDKHYSEARSIGNTTISSTWLSQMIKARYNRVADVKQVQTVIDTSEWPKYLNPEEYHVGKKYFNGFLQPLSRGTCYLHAVLNALSFTKLAPKLYKLLASYGVYGTYSADMQYATVFTDHVFTELSVHREYAYDGGDYVEQMNYTLKQLGFSKRLSIEPYVTTKSDFHDHISDTGMIIKYDIKREKKWKINELINTVETTHNMEVICGILNMKQLDSNGYHVVACITCNQIRCLMDSRDLVRHPYDWKSDDFSKLNIIAKKMNMVPISFSYLAMNPKYMF